MCRVVNIALLLFISGVLAGDGDKCKKLLDYGKKPLTCCKEPPVNPDDKDKLETMKIEAEIEKCKDESDDAEAKQCSEKQLCIAKNMGLADDDGNEDKEAVNKLFEKSFKDAIDSNVYDAIKKNCIDDYPKDMDWCYFEFLKYCAGLHYVIGCKEWKDEDNCDEVKNAVSECEKSL